MSTRMSRNKEYIGATIPPREYQLFQELCRHLGCNYTEAIRLLIMDACKRAGLLAPKPSEPPGPAAKPVPETGYQYDEDGDVIGIWL